MKFANHRILIQTALRLECFMWPIRIDSYMQVWYLCLVEWIWGYSPCIPGAPSGEVAELSEVTLLGLGVRLRDDGLGCGDERCFRRKRGDSEGDLLFGDLQGRRNRCSSITLLSITEKWVENVFPSQRKAARWRHTGKSASGNKITPIPNWRFLCYKNNMLIII